MMSFTTWPFRIIQCENFNEIEVEIDHIRGTEIHTNRLRKLQKASGMQVSCKNCLHTEE